MRRREEKDQEMPNTMRGLSKFYKSIVLGTGSSLNVAAHHLIPLVSSQRYIRRGRGAGI